MGSLVPALLSFALLCTKGYASPSPPIDARRALNVNAKLPSLSSLTDITATATPTSPGEASSILSSLFHAKPTPSDLVSVAEEIVQAGLTTDNFVEALAYVENGFGLTGENSDANVNLKDPSPAAYPKASASDAPYSLTEAQLRAAIHIPSTYQYGVKGAPQPAILCPGTGSTGYLSYVGNYIPLLQNSTIADPVWLNIPEYLLGDVQVNAEYVAYAINYIYGISNQRSAALLAWSQGNVDAQWAYKYWPSTRAHVTDHIGFSADYYGSDISVISNGALPPSFIQQGRGSEFIATLRKDGGDAAYVATTSIYSGFYDEVVEPQQGRNASAFLKSSSLAQASNNEVQLLCPDQPAGALYTHEGVLYNPLGFALLKDALSHAGPGRPSRLNLATVCSTFLTPGLDLTDFLVTENTIPFALVVTELYPDKTTTEPPIMPYARGT